MGTTATKPRAARPVDGETPPMLSVRGLRHGYELGSTSLAVLRGVDVDVYPGEIVAIVGRSGSGKSTLLHLAGGLAAPQEGEVWLEGEALSSMSARSRAIARRQRVGFVFQAFHLLPGLTVIENVAMPLLLNGEHRHRAAEKARPLLEAVGIAGRADHLPSELSGGELQRAAIARSLVAEPLLVLADEPTGNLDSTTAEEIIELLVSRVRNAQLAMLLVTHDADIAARADRVLTMADGVLT
jgi:lipoprotein-releasing system ATP-binding protein